MARALSPHKVLLSSFEQSRALVALFNGDQQLVYLNPVGEKLLGVSAANLLGEKAAYAVQASEINVLAKIAPPPDAFAGKVSCGSILLENEQGTATETPVIFLPLRSPPSEEISVLLMAGNKEWLAHFQNHAFAEHAWHAAIQALQATQPLEFRQEYLVGNSPRMKRLREQLKLAGNSSARTFITGEPGSGCELLVNSIHALRKSPTGLVMLDCEIHDGDSITAVLRRGGNRDQNPSLWLKNVSKLSPPTQKTLLEILRTTGNSLHIISTSPISLARMIRKRRFSRELAAELSILKINVPTLRSRPEDLPLLAQWCVEKQNAAGGRAWNGLLPAALDRLAVHRWPGNVDECREVIAAACQQAQGLWITPADLPERIHAAWENLAHPPREQETIQLDAFLAEIETEILRRSLAQSRGNKSKASQLLGISRPRLLRRLVQLGLVSPEEEKIDFQPLDDSNPAGVSP